MTLKRFALKPLASRFVAGETEDDTVAYVEDLNDDGIKGLIDILGEHVTDEEAAEAAADRYVSLIDAMAAANLNASVSLKLTHLGLDIGKAFCEKQLRRVMAKANEENFFVWIDMEEAAYVDDTLAVFKAVHEDHEDIGITLQCTLKRSEDDLKSLDESVSVRLVKGAYTESADIAYTDQQQIDTNYRNLLEYLFGHQDYMAVATHDTEMIRYAQELEQEYDRPRISFEFESLKGVKDGLERELVEDGYTVGEYVPFGEEWPDYVQRRLREWRHSIVRHVRSTV